MKENNLNKDDLKEYLDLLWADINNNVTHLKDDLDIIWGLLEQLSRYNKILDIYFKMLQDELVNELELEDKFKIGDTEYTQRWQK